MKIVIAGADSVGRSVALELLDHGHEYTLIDNQPNKLHVTSVADADWILADACSPDTLANAGLAQTDVMVVAAGDDKANLVISLLAETEFTVSRVIARLNNPKSEWLLDASWSVDMSVSAPRIMTALVGEAISVSIPVRPFSFNSTEISMYATILPEESPLVGRRIIEVNLPPRTVPTSLLRSGRPITPPDDDVLEAEDELLLLISDLEENALDILTRLVKVPEPEVNEEAEEQV